MTFKDNMNIQNTEKRPELSKNILLILATVVGCVVVSALVRPLYSPPSAPVDQPLYDQVLMEVAGELNKSLPMMINSETRLDTTVALPGKILQYHCTLINQEKKDIDIPELKEMMRPSMIQTLRTSPQMNIFRKEKVMMEYHYKDKNGEYLFTIPITPEQYADGN